MIELRVSFNSEPSNKFYEDLVKMVEEYPDVQITEAQDAKFSDTRKKGYKIKSKFGAKLDPFVSMFKDDIPIRGFYSEVGECTVDNIKFYLEYYLNEVI